MRRRFLPCLAIAALLAGGCTTSGFRSMAEVEEPEVRTTPGGVEVQDLRPGRGQPVLPGARVRFHFTGRVEGGAVFDTSHDRGRPEELELGAGETALAGLEEGLLGMRERGLRRLRIPPHLAYGERGLEGLVPPDAAVVIEIELLEVLNP